MGSSGRVDVSGVGSGNEVDESGIASASNVKDRSSVGSDVDRKDGEVGRLEDDHANCLLKHVRMLEEFPGDSSMYVSDTAFGMLWASMSSRRFL
jgi:hypothetical protein